MNNFAKKVSKYMGVFLFTLLAALIVSSIVPMDTFGIQTASTVQAAAKLNKTSLSLPKGGSTQLSVSGTSKKVTWKSSNTKVATVSSKGKVSAKKAGKATITAKVDGKTYSCSVKVVSFKSNTSAITMTKGKTYNLKITGTSSKVTYKSKKTAIATVSSKGKVAAKKKGSTTITVKAGKETLSIPITVETPSISKTKLTVSKGKSATLKVNGTSRTVKWSSNNKTVATVNSKGKVTAKSSGQAIITAKLNDKSYTCVVTVGTPVFSGLPDSVTVGFGSTKSYTLTVKARVDMTVSIADSSICDWDANPRSYDVGDKIAFDFIGLKPGVTNITFTAENGWKKVIPITVTATKIPTTGENTTINNVTFNSFAVQKSANETTPVFNVEGSITNNINAALSSLRIYYTFYDAAGNALYTSSESISEPKAGQTYNFGYLYRCSIYSEITNAASVKITNVVGTLATSAAYQQIAPFNTQVDPASLSGFTITNLNAVYGTGYYSNTYIGYMYYNITNNTSSSKSIKVYYDAYDANGQLIPQKYPEYDSLYLRAGETKVVAPSSNTDYIDIQGDFVSGSVSTVKLRIVEY